jgi:hypothetical protein
MNGGTISGNSAGVGGGGVCFSHGSFTLTNGTISGNTAGSDSVLFAYGGGVYMTTALHAGGNAIFTMNGGNISNNTVTALVASYGAGVYIEMPGPITNMPDVAFKMTGGAITGNTSSGGSVAYGGGVHLIAHSAAQSRAIFEMTGGTLGNNRSVAPTPENSLGAGVYVDRGTFNIGAAARIEENNPVCLAPDYSNTIYLVKALNSVNPVARIDLYGEAASWLDKAILTRGSSDYPSGLPLPVSLFPTGNFIWGDLTSIATGEKNGGGTSGERYFINPNGKLQKR